MQILHLLLVVAAVPLLLLDKLGSLQEMILNPVLGTIQDKRIDHHYEEQFQVCVTFKYT